MRSDIKKAESIFKSYLYKSLPKTPFSEPLKVWQIFKEFAHHPFECVDKRYELDSDSVLFECGIYNFTGNNKFHFNFVRQFYVLSEGEFVFVDQLHCDFTCPPNEELKTLQARLWSSDCSSMEEFFQRVESLREFQIGVRCSNYTCEIYYAEI